MVAGGKGEDEQTLLSSIAILNITTPQWSTPGPDILTLPWPMYGMQFTISNEHLYVSSVCIKFDVATNENTTTSTVCQLPLTVLENVLTTEGANESHHWTEIAPTPYCHSTILQDTAHVVAVGGDESYTPTSDVFVYDPNSNKWSKVGQLGVPWACCAVVSLSSTSFIVCGGFTNPRDPKNTRLTSVEIVYF